MLVGAAVSDRKFPDWISSFVSYSSVTEAPRRMHFWSGVSAIAGALRRRVWLDMKRFVWYPSFYVIFVAPPGIVSKSTTADISMDLLRQVPGIRFGPNSITWQGLVQAFESASEAFQLGEEFHPMAPLTFVASELGSLVNLQDRDMVNLLIEMWDGKKSYEKMTKMSGDNTIEAPWINIIGCTTPHWIADNMPPATIGGGLSSRCVFIYASEKEKYVPFVDEVVNGDDLLLRSSLITDLERISNIAGPFRISEPARAFERARYEKFWRGAAERMDSQMLEGYAARKQTHLFKLGMVLSASRGDSLMIEAEDVQLANAMLEDIELDMPKVFSRIGRSADSLQAETLVDVIRKRGGEIPYTEAYKIAHLGFPNFHDFEGILSGLMQSGKLVCVSHPSGPRLKVGQS